MTETKMTGGSVSFIGFGGAEAPELFNPQERTELAVEALDSLGLVTDRAKELDTVGLQMHAFHDLLSNDRPEVAVEPFWSLELTDGFGLDALIAALNKRPHRLDPVYHALWDQFTPAELNNRQASGRPGGIAVRAMLLGGDSPFGEPGLYYSGLDTEAQRQATKGKAVLGPVDYIMLQAQRRVVVGALPLDGRTCTNFVQLGAKTVHGDDSVPNASWGNDLIELHGTRKGDAHPSLGVRLLLKPVAAASSLAVARHPLQLAG